MANQYDVRNAIVNAGHRTPINTNQMNQAIANYSALNQASPYLARTNQPMQEMANVRRVQPQGFSSLAPSNQQMMEMANVRGQAGQKRTGAGDTPPNWRDNLLNYIVSPKGRGMAQGLLEASGYSEVPVTFGQALAMGMNRGTEAETAAAASQLTKDQFAFQKEQFAETKAQNAVANFLTNKKIDVDLQNALKPQLSSFTKSLMAAGIDPASPQGLELLEKELAKATSTITLDQKSETEYQKERGTYTAKKLNKIEDDAGMALDNIQNYDAIETLLPMFETGAFSESIMGINKIGQRFGMDLNFGGDTGAAEAIRGLTGKLVMNTLADFKGAISDSERQFAKDINIGLGMSKDGIRSLVAINRRIYQRQITKADIALTWEEKNGSLLKKNAKGQSFNTFWKEYMNDNPIFDDDFKEQLQQQAGKVDAEFEDQVQVIDGKRYIDLDGTIYELKGTE
jgi:hypothetical protein